MTDSVTDEPRLPAEAEPEKRFEVYIRCEDADFQGSLYGGAVLKYLNSICRHVAAGRFSGPLYDEAGKTVGLWKTHWRNDDPEDRPPPRRMSAKG